MFGKQESKDSHILCALIPTTSDSSCSRSGFLGLHHPVLQVPSLRLLQVIIRGREGCWIPRLEIFTGMLPLIQCAGIGAVCGSQCLQGTSWIGPWATGASRAQGTSLAECSGQTLAVKLVNLGPNLPSRLICEMFQKVRDYPGDLYVAAVCRRVCPVQRQS